MCIKDWWGKGGGGVKERKGNEGKRQAGRQTSAGRLYRAVGRRGKRGLDEGAEMD